jgi:hypothetical protein
MNNANLEMTKAGDELVAINYGFGASITYRFKTVTRTTKTLIIFDEAGTPVVRKTGHYQGTSSYSRREHWQPATPEHHAAAEVHKTWQDNVRLVGERCDSWRKIESMDKDLLAKIANLLRGAAQ